MNNNVLNFVLLPSVTQYCHVLRCTVQQLWSTSMYITLHCSTQSTAQYCDYVTLDTTSLTPPCDSRIGQKPVNWTGKICSEGELSVVEYSVVPGSSTNNCPRDDPLFPLAALPCEHPVWCSLHWCCFVCYTLCGLFVLYTALSGKYSLCTQLCHWTVCAGCQTLCSPRTVSVSAASHSFALPGLFVLPVKAEFSPVCALTSIQWVLYTALHNCVFFSVAVCLLVLSHLEAWVGLSWHCSP